MSNKKVLVVDDEVKIVELVKLYLNRDGYQVVTAYDGTEALRLARETHPDLIVLDIMLPGIDGLEVCRRLRAGGPVPILILTAKDTVNDRIQGLDMGADDYMVKPFNLDELLARIRALLRRAQPSRPQVLRFADLSLAIVKLMGAGEYAVELPGDAAPGHFVANADHGPLADDARGRRWNAVPLAELLGERLGALDLGGGARGAEHRQRALCELVRDPLHER